MQMVMEGERAPAATDELADVYRNTVLGMSEALGRAPRPHRNPLR
jgi:hypothetical protein